MNSTDNENQKKEYHPLDLNHIRVNVIKEIDPLAAMSMLPYDVHRVILSFMDRPALEYGLYEASKRDQINDKRSKNDLAIAWNVKDKISPYRRGSMRLRRQALRIANVSGTSRYIPNVVCKSFRDVEVFIHIIDAANKGMFRSSICGGTCSDIDLYRHWGNIYRQWKQWATEQWFQCSLGVSQLASDNINEKPPTPFVKEYMYIKWLREAMDIYDEMYHYHV